MHISAYNGSVSLAQNPSFHSINSHHGKCIIGFGVSISSVSIDSITAEDTPEYKKPLKGNVTPPVFFHEIMTMRIDGASFFWLLNKTSPP